jgi:hypothetical protein
MDGCIGGITLDEQSINDQNQAQPRNNEPKSKKPRSISQSELPRVTLEQTIPVATAIYENVAGNSIAFEDLAKLLGTSPKSTITKYTIWASEAYGLIIKNESGQYLLSETGRKIVAPTYKGEDSEAKIKAILTPTILSKFYSEYDKHPIPQDSFFLNMLESKMGIPRDRVAAAREIIMDNANFTGILRHDESNDKNIINLESPSVHGNSPANEYTEKEERSEIQTTNSNTEKYCFVICPIGIEGSEERKHSDMLLKHLIEPVLHKFGLKVVRADKIDKSGLITQQIFENLLKATLCIADLSFNNPNVFYELGVRHMSQLPSIQIIKKGDKIPFDVSHGRTIVIDTSDVYTLIDRMESAKKELYEYVKGIVDNLQTEVSDDNPIRVYMPGIKVNIPR